MAPGRGGRGGRGRGGGDKGGGGTGVERRGLGGRGSRGGAPTASATRPLSDEADALATKLQSCAFQKRDAERAEASAARAAADTAKLERERADAEARAEELRRAKAARATLRSLNLDPVRPDAAAFRAMDSSIKRNTALTKKLSKITEETRASILDDLSKVNISKYVTEAVAATVEGKLRAADVPAALEIVSKLHRVYPDFAPALAEALPRFVCPDAKAHAPSATAALAAVRAAASGDAADTETPTPAQRRLKSRLLSEAHLVGILPSAGPVHKCVVSFAAERHDRDSEAFAHSLLALGAFARLFREEYLGVAEDGTTTADGTTSSADGTTSSGEAPSGTSGGAGSDLPGAGAAFRLTPERQAAFRAALEGFHAHACDALATEHRALRSVERENARALERVGAVSEAASAAFSAASKARDATMKALGTLSEALRLPMPTLPEEEEEKSRKTEGEVALQRGVDVGWDGSGAAWDDEESKIFYENLPDLRAMVPAALLSSAGANDGGSGDDSASASTSAKAEALLARLPTLVLKDAADTFSCDFCFAAGGAASRRRLVESLASVPRDETQRLPFYARVAATLAAVFPEEVGAPVTAAIVHEFETLRRASAGDRVSLERRATNARYLGELVKFRLVHASFAFDALKALIETFRGFDVDAACALLESCGRYLAKHPDTAARASAILDVFLRLKSVKNLDARQIELVDAAYRACRPPETPARRKTRSPVREYVRHLVYEILSDDALPRVVRQLRKLDWAEHERYVVKCVVKVHRGRFDNVATVARLVGAMSKWRDSFRARASSTPCWRIFVSDWSRIARGRISEGARRCDSSGNCIAPKSSPRPWCSRNSTSSSRSDTTNERRPSRERRRATAIDRRLRTRSIPRRSRFACDWCARSWRRAVGSSTAGLLENFSIGSSFFSNGTVSPKTRRWTSPKTSPTCSPSSDPNSLRTRRTTRRRRSARASRLTRRAPREADGARTRITWTRLWRKRKRRTRWTVRKTTTTARATTRRTKTTTRNRARDRTSRRNLTRTTTRDRARIRARIWTTRGRVVSWTSPRSACDAPRRGRRARTWRISSARWRNFSAPRRRTYTRRAPHPAPARPPDAFRADTRASVRPGLPGPGRGSRRWGPGRAPAASSRSRC